MEKYLSIVSQKIARIRTEADHRRIINTQKLVNDFTVEPRRVWVIQGPACHSDRRITLVRALSLSQAESGNS